ncbi:MAG: hypothetical protein EBR82_71775 [Caulobacteraceae bacterium]|nr:hypothetical protein [Caulobacteraceae bacterium]
MQGYDVEKCDVVLLVNDDITFLPGALDTFAEYAIARRDAYMVTVLGYHHHYAKHTELGQQPLWGFGFSCFAVNPIGWETIGCFDENIAPIYFEDCDFGQRGYLAGLHMAECKTAGVIHWGSLSAKQDGQAAYLETKNPISAQYYTQKWGCLPGNGEQFTRPFNDDALPRLSTLPTLTDSRFSTKQQTTNTEPRHARYCTSAHKQRVVSLR